jgi:cell division protein FtsQ
MWDNAPLLRSVANWLIGISIVLVLYGAARHVMQLPIFPLNMVRLSVAPKQVPVELLQRVVKEQVQGNFFTVDLNRTRLLFEQLPWVRKVSVRRKFPWSLEINIEEHVALAHWNDKELVNTHGEVFTAESKEALPVFVGQPNTSVQLAGMYGELSGKLAQLKQEIAQLSLSPRFAWQARLKNGLVLELGREQMQQRMARFVEVYPYSLATLPGSAKHVDLRYRDGFAVYLPNGAETQDKQAPANKV